MHLQKIWKARSGFTCKTSLSHQWKKRGRNPISVCFGTVSITLAGARGTPNDSGYWILLRLFVEKILGCIYLCGSEVNVGAYGSMISGLDGPVIVAHWIGCPCRPGRFDLLIWIASLQASQSVQLNQEIKRRRKPFPSWLKPGKCIARIKKTCCSVT